MIQTHNDESKLKIHTNFVEAIILVKFFIFKS